MEPSERPAPDPAKLLEAWMEWERGNEMPGRTMSTLKTGGLRILLEALVAEMPVVLAAATAPAEELAPDAVEAWTPIV
jgi:hypothetical protein